MILGTQGSMQQSVARFRLARRGGNACPLPFAELDAEPATGIVPCQRARGSDREAGSALQAGGVLHGDGSVGFLAVNVGRAAGDDGLAGSSGLGDLLVDLDVALLFVEEEAVLGQAFGGGRKIHSARAPAMPSRT